MAEVMQPFTQPSATITMLQSRSSSSDAYQGPNVSQNYQQQQQQQQQRGGQNSRNMHNVHQSGHRGTGTSTAPVQPYAFQSTPHLRQENRTISGGAPPPPSNLQSSVSSPIYNSARHGFNGPASNASSTTSSSPSLTARRVPSRDDLPSADRPSSFISLSSSVPDLSLTNFDTTAKSSPDRYRRAARRTDSNNSITQASQHTSAAPSGSGMSAVEHLYTPPPTLVSRNTNEDSAATRSPESAKRYRRRSLGGNLDAAATSAPQPVSPTNQRPSSQGTTGLRQSQASTIRPVSQHERTPSGESVQSRGRGAPTPDGDGSRSRTTSPSPAQGLRREASPGRLSARAPSDGPKRLVNPSPLSQSAYSRDQPGNAQSPAKTAHASSPAAQHLAALSDKDLNKGMKSRLRRAFSFGTAAEMRRASGENVPPPQTMAPGQTGEELDNEQLEIAKRQEAAGFGAGIYSGQGGFSGSTDNLSISSTASSASLMLRKMGKGMKKGGRSLKGLFRPKSVIGVPAADGPIQPSLAQVSMVTVEAERQKVNVNANPADQLGGGTGFPKLERNSIDASQQFNDRPSSKDRTDSMRKSIVGSEKERAEVLAAVRKGILKRSATGSPQLSPVASHAPVLPDAHVTLSPSSSVPGTPRDDRQSRSLTSTTSASSNDYFSKSVNGSKSMPQTPSSGRNISFSPRIQFHDVWSSTEYDRRGDVATCNRLTPMLAQQIKEELNTFKMEMEVHEMSKPHTHFF